MSKKLAVYLVWGYSGEHEDHEDHIVAAFTDKAKAEERKRLCEAARDRIQEWLELRRGAERERDLAYDEKHGTKTGDPEGSWSYFGGEGCPKNRYDKGMRDEDTSYSVSTLKVQA